MEDKPKTIQITLSDKIYKKLVEVKGNRTWYMFVRDILSENKVDK